MAVFDLESFRRRENAIIAGNVARRVCVSVLRDGIRVVDNLKKDPDSEAAAAYLTRVVTMVAVSEGRPDVSIADMVGLIYHGTVAIRKRVASS